MFRHVTTRFAGLVILIAGLWGGLVPFVGHYFHFALGPDKAWAWTSGRFYLSVLPAIAAVLGGLILLGSGPRVSGKVGALLALAGGVWFAVGPTVSLLWATDAEGLAHGHKVTRMLELLTYHTGLGVLIASFAAYALPGVAVGRRALAADAAAGTATGAGARETTAARPGAVGPRTAEPAGTAPAGAATGEPATAGPRTAASAAPAGEAPGARRRWFGLFGRRSVRA